MKSFSIAEARRVALTAQGFSNPRITDREVVIDDLADVFSRVKIIQIDPINVVVRAQYMPFFSRLGKYRPSLLEELAYKDRSLFEHLAHEASYVPIESMRLLRHRMAGWTPWKNWQKYIDQHPGIEDKVLDAVRERGPLSVSDLDYKREKAGIWSYTPAKLALEAMLRRGQLAVSSRNNAVRLYDLIERVVPAELLAEPMLDKEEAHREMLLSAADALGVCTAADMADYYRIRRREVLSLIDDLVETGKLEPVKVDGSQSSFYTLPSIEPSSHPVQARSLLTPFDPLIWCRERVEWLFDFFYRIEIYTPVKKRKYGYYVMPFLMDEKLVARVDLKADRPKNTLRVPGAFLEADQDAEKVSHELALELQEMAEWLGLHRVVIGRRGNLTNALRYSIKNI